MSGETRPIDDAMTCLGNAIFKFLFRNKDPTQAAKEGMTWPNASESTR
jgi:hypothetical protein